MQKITGNYELRRALHKAAPVILACASAAGLVTTVILSVRATTKASSMIEDEEEQANLLYDRSLTKVEELKIAAPCYIPTVLAGAATIGCIVGACMFTRKQQAAYICAYSTLQTAFSEYRQKTNELYGDGADENVKAEVIEQRARESHFLPTGEKVVFYEEYRNEFFERSVEEVYLAEYHLNRNFRLRGYAFLNEFYDFLGLEPIEIGDDIGWSEGVGEAYYGYVWIDFVHTEKALENGHRYYVISMPFEPHDVFESM